MTEEPRLRTIFEHFLALNHEAFATGHYSIAYYALAAALHTAQARQNVDGLATVERIAGEQLASIDRAAPEYEHSTQSAKARGRTSIFTMLAHQARTAFRILQQQHGSP